MSSRKNQDDYDIYSTIRNKNARELKWARGKRQLKSFFLESEVARCDGVSWRKLFSGFESSLPKYRGDVPRPRDCQESSLRSYETSLFFRLLGTKVHDGILGLAIRKNYDFDSLGTRLLSLPFFLSSRPCSLSPSPLSLYSPSPSLPLSLSSSTTVFIYFYFFLLL